MGHFPLRKILDLAGLRSRQDTPKRPSPAPSSMPLALGHRKEEPWIGAVRARSLCVVSGKGGTGKSVTSASLARLFARHARTLLFDADLGVGNAHILQGSAPQHTLGDVLGGAQTLGDIVHPCGENLDMIAGGSGVARLAALSVPDLASLGDNLANLERDYSYVIADCGAGISETTLGFARASDSLLIVTTPDLTAMTDAYAFLKVLGERRGDAKPMLLINRAMDQAEASAAAERICNVSQRFLSFAPEYIGWVPEDRSVFESVNQRRPLILHAPDCAAAAAIRRIGATVQERVDAQHPRGLGRRLAAGATAALRMA